MKRLNRKKLILGATSIALFCSAFIGILTNNNLTLASFDFSNNEECITLKPSEVITKLTGDNVSSIESNYIDNFSKFNLSYQTNPNKNQFTIASFDSDLYVQAEKYTYTDSSKRTLSWIPTTFEYNGVNYVFEESDGIYKSKINCFDESDTNIKINYSLSLELDKELSNELINKTYFLSKEYSDERDSINAYNKSKTDEYNEAYSQYQNDHKKYLDDYAQYLLDYAAWEQNEEDILTYDSRKVKYDAYKIYLSDLEEYNNYLQALEDYNNQWNAYNQYVIDKQAYDANKVKYDAYIKSQSRIDFCLNTMNIFFEQMPFTIDGQATTRSIYDAVMGGTVTEVLNNKADIVTAGVDTTAVDKASVATTGLRNIMTAYKALNTDKERYSFYHDYYLSDILTHSENLLRSLEYFLRNNMVYSYLNTKGKLYKYDILVAQLMYLCNVLDTQSIKNYEYDKGTSSSANAALLNETSKIDGKTYSQILGDSVKLSTDGDMAYPYYVTAPDPVEALPEPTYVEKPGSAPTVVEEPAEVEYAEDPGEKPVHYDCPTFSEIDPTMPSEPTLKEFDESKVALADAYNTLLFYRDEFSENPIITFEESYECDFKDQLLHVARFYDNDGELIQEQFFDTSITYSGVIPTKPGDAIFSDYDFDKWVDKNGNTVDLDNISYSLCLYPTFIGGNYNYYDVTWIIPNNSEGEETIVTSCRANEVPTFPFGTPSRTDYGDNYYVFTSWDKTLEIVTSNQTYTALFEENHYYVCYVSNYEDNAAKIRKSFKTIEEVDDYINTFNPTKSDTKTNYFVFKEWSLTITNDYYYEYVATFQKESFLYVYYVIDGVSTRQDHKYKKGETILPYQGEEPTKEASGNIKYVFVGWDYDYSIPISSTTYINAIFEEHYYYTVSFVNNGTLLSEVVYEKGSTVVEPSTESFNYYKDGYYYAFDGWDKTITEVSKDITYTAIYTATPVVIDGDTLNAINIEINDDAIIINCKSYTNIDISLLLQLINTEIIKSTDIKFIFDDCTITINSTNTGYLSRKGISALIKTYELDSHNVHTFSLMLLDNAGNVFEDELVYANICINGNFNNGKINVNENSNKKAYTLSNETTLNIDSIKLNTVYTIVPYYTITVVGGEDAQVNISANTGVFGQTISIEILVQDGYRFNGGYIQYGTNRIEISNGQFVMPDADVTIILNVEHIVYCVTFVVDGNVYAEVYGYYGETITMPNEPSKVSDENYNYVFTGWDKNGETFTQNDTYTAIFKGNEIVKVNITNKLGRIQIGLICVSGVVVVGVGVFLFFRIRKKKKLKKK